MKARGAGNSSCKGEGVEWLAQVSRHGRAAESFGGARSGWKGEKKGWQMEVRKQRKSPRRKGGGNGKQDALYHPSSHMSRQCVGTLPSHVLNLYTPNLHTNNHRSQFVFQKSNSLQKATPPAS
ncbi:hypothetical protein Mapa_007563 [Marchantia paleacea]|nr:hypothetical protein Mapa_007563 [Marchantia paleacea]